MTPTVKKTIIICAIGSGVIIGACIVVPAIRRHNIRARLDAAYKDPSTIGGGMDKLILEGVFDIDRYDSGSNKATISLVTARQKAKQVWDNYSWYSTNQAAIVSAFNGLQHIDDVSKIAHEFFHSYDEEMLSVLKEVLTDKTQYNLFVAKISKLKKD